MDFCKAWLISRALKTLILTILARDFIAFMDERYSGSPSSTILAYVTEDTTLLNSNILCEDYFCFLFFFNDLVEYY